jgi:hypothetical protein
MSLPVESANDPETAARAACGRIAARPAGEVLSDSDIQAVLAAGVRLYAARVADAETRIAAFPDGGAVTATDAMVTVTAIMQAVNVQVFELGMWQAWSGR